MSNDIPRTYTIDRPIGFVSEICRVARKGYIEYPRIYYEYLYNFREHRNILRRRGDTICWMPKSAMGLDRFFEVNKFFYESLLCLSDIISRSR